MDHKSEYLLLFHGNNCYANAPRYYVKRTLPVLSRLSLPKQNEQHTKCTKMHLHKALYSGSIRASSGRLPTIKSSSIPTLSNILFLNLGMCVFVSYALVNNTTLTMKWYDCDTDICDTLFCTLISRIVVWTQQRTDCVISRVQHNARRQASIFTYAFLMRFSNPHWNKGTYSFERSYCPMWQLTCGCMGALRLTRRPSVGAATSDAPISGSRVTASAQNL